MEQAAEKLTFITDPAQCRAVAAAALKRYQDYQAQTDGSNPKPVKLERMCAMTKGDGHAVLHMDSKCDQHSMFNDMRLLPFGVTPEPNMLVEIAEKGVPAIIPRGKGNAIVVADSGAVIEFTIALLVPDLDVNLASVEQTMVQKKVKVRFGEHLDMVYHRHGKSIFLDAGYGLRVRPLNSSEFEYICKEYHGVTPDVITSGKAAGGPSGKLSVAERAWLMWDARLPGVF
eukprot:5038911-Pleurochrysis_carterae.AAC.1